jgi:hypothetical protein
MPTILPTGERGALRDFGHDKLAGPGERGVSLRE